MNIWLPIVINVVSLLIITAFVITASKRTLKVDVVKTVLMILSLIGCAVLTDFLVDKLLELEAVAGLVENIKTSLAFEQVDEVARPVFFILAYFISFGLISVICIIINTINRAIVRKKIYNGVVPRRIKGVNTKVEKEIKTIENQKIKERMTSKNVVNFAFKIFTGVLMGIIVVLVVLLATKQIFDIIQLETVSECYTYTLSGLLRNCFGVDFDAILGFGDKLKTFILSFIR